MSSPLGTEPPIIIAPGEIILNGRKTEAKVKTAPQVVKPEFSPHAFLLSNDFMGYFMNQKRRGHDNSETSHNFPSPSLGETTEKISIHPDGEADADYKQRRNSDVFDFFLAKNDATSAFEGLLTKNIAVVV